MMKERKTDKLDLTRKRIAHLADKYYNEGKYVSALRFAHRELAEYGGDPDVFARLCDIYEAMGLQGSAINYWFRFLDVAVAEDLPDIYEGLAVNFLGIGNERQSAYYYNLLVDADDTLPEETKQDIADAFAMDKRDNFRFVYPPHLADYSNEINSAGKALKNGDLNRVFKELAKVSKGSKSYHSAKELEAVAHLLDGNPDEAEKACREILKENPDSIEALATLSAVHLERGETEESFALASKLVKMKPTNNDEIFKIATVACENGLHAEAYEKFAELDEKIPYDGRTLYFKGVSAYNSGKTEEAKRALEELTTIYPDAEVAKYYLRAIRAYEEGKEAGEQVEPPTLIYFYHLPQEEREHRCQTLLQIGSCPQDEAQLFGLLALHDGYFTWCFDEMDGGDRDLQYLSVVTAAHVRADEFLQDVLLDFEVADVFKVEILRMLMERNEELTVGVVLCCIYREVSLYKIKVGRKRRKKFIEGYARVASKFALISEGYAEKIKDSAERLYRLLEKGNGLDLITDPNDVACAIYLLAGFEDLGKDKAWIASAFDANLSKVHVLLSYTVNPWEAKDRKEEKNKENETH